MPKNISAEEVRHLLDYDPATGEFIWKNPKPGLNKGAIAGTTSPFGYRIIMINQICYRAHWLAWLILHGEWPTHFIDHINLDRSDNRQENLREATNGQNVANSLQLRKISGLPKGVIKYKNGRFGAQIVANKVHHYLGIFDSAEDAHAAYAKKATELHGEFARAS